MRVALFAITVLGLAGFAPGYAAAQSTGSVKASYHYDTCSCRFGYGSVCVASVSCASNGGHCSGTCSPPPFATLTNR
jgi:hypothetical protein